MGHIPDGADLAVVGVSRHDRVTVDVTVPAQVGTPRRRHGKPVVVGEMVGGAARQEMQEHRLIVREGN